LSTMHRLLVPALLMAAVSAYASEGPLPAQKSATVFGQSIRYIDVGSGPVVVLLHGLGSSGPGDWGRVILPLSAHHRVLAPDLLGFGASDKPLIDYRIQTWVDFVGEFLRQANVTHFTLVGESLGGWISAQYAIQSLGGVSAGDSFVLPRPDRLVLCDAAGHAHHGGAAPAFPLDTSSLEGSRNLLRAIFYGPSFSTDPAVRAFFEHSLSKGDGYTTHSFISNPGVAAEFVDGKLGGVNVPTLVIWGEHDAIVPLDDGRDYAAKIPGARMVVIPESAHAPCIEKPEAFLAALLPFLD
jgi:pimeloyl-ACP methyl ester carboxylesterase